MLALGSPYGHVKSARYVMRPGEGKSFGFILYGSVAEAQHAILGLMDGGYKVGFARETLKEKMERVSRTVIIVPGCSRCSPDSRICFSLHFPALGSLRD